MFDGSLLLIAAGGIVFLLYLVIFLRMSPFIALLLTCFVVGLGVGMSPEDVINSIKKGMGGTLGFVAVVVGLGAILGKMLESSGGVERIADTLIARFGAEKVQWSLGLTGFLVAIPVFFDVAFIILVPLVYGLANKTGRSLLYYAIPLLAGLAITHTFIPPTPGPIAVAELINAQLGWVILFGAIAGVPAMIIGGPIFGRYIAQRIHVPVPASHQPALEQADGKGLSFTQVMVVITLPLVLIMLNTLAPFLLDKASTPFSILSFIGHPFVALTLATLLAMLLVKKECDVSNKALLDIANKGLEPAGMIILITGAGGAFKQLLIDSGVGGMLGELMLASNMPLILLAFLIAAVTRIAQGSATVAMITSAGLMAPILELQPQSPAMLGILVIAISSGATILSHVNDSGFWLVNRYLGMSESDTLKSWTALSTIIALIGLASCLVLSLFV